MASLALVGVFILTGSGSDLQYMLSPVGAPTQQSQQRQVDLGAEQRKDLEAQLAAFKEQLEAAPDSSEALEGVAVINARLGNFKVRWGCACPPVGRGLGAWTGCHPRALPAGLHSHAGAFGRLQPG